MNGMIHYQPTTYDLTNIHHTHTTAVTISQPVTLGTPTRNQNNDQVADNNSDSKPAAKKNRPYYGTKPPTTRKVKFNTKRPKP